MVCMMQVVQAPALATQAPDAALQHNGGVLPLELGVASNVNAEVTHGRRCM